MRFHNVAADRLFTGSVDGLICMFDTTKGQEDDSLISGTQLINNKRRGEERIWRLLLFTGIVCVLIHCLTFPPTTQ